jgi:hypothetical protein
MDWIKRNLVFVIGAVVALVLMGLAGWYCFSGWTNSSEQTVKLTEGYTELKRLKGLSPSPGEGKINNIELAKEQQKEAQAFLAKLGTRLQSIPAMIEGTNIASKDYKVVLQDTISDLQRDATNNSVIVPSKYNFSFEKQAGLMKFADGTLQPLAVQLGEIKVICEVLNEAKVNTLEGIRRERVPGSPDDLAGTPTDYLDMASTTNELSIITPYEVTFRCFTPELANVLAGFARSPYGLLVKAINSEHAPASMVADTAAPQPVYYAQPAVAPQPYPRPITGEEGGRPGGAFASRYGGAGGPGGYRSPYAAVTPVAAPVAQPIAVSPGSKSGLQVFLKEKELRITMLIHVVKLLPSQK